MLMMMGAPPGLAQRCRGKELEFDICRRQDFAGEGIPRHYAGDARMPGAAGQGRLPMKIFALR